MTKGLGRNERCSCGSGKKYKHCCALKVDRLSLTSRLWLALVGLMLLTGAIFALTSLDEIDDGLGPAPGRVWSQEHQHWH